MNLLQTIKEGKEMILDSQCDAGDVVTGWVLQSESVQTLLTTYTISILEAQNEELEGGYDAGKLW